MGGTTVLLCLLAMVWAATDSDDRRWTFELQGQQTDYYNLLVDGFLDGHLHMKVPPDASGQLPYLMDASLHEGKYYLYFGVVPAVLLFLPYAWLTGHDLPMNAAVLVMVAGGFIFSLWLYRNARRACFPAVPAGLEAACILLLAFGGGTAILCVDGGFYEVAIAGGYLCFSATFLGLFQAIQGGSRAPAWLLWASVWAGLAVGCRPTYLFALPVLLLPVWLAWRRRTPAPGRRSIARLAAAAIIPAALVGLALALYNYGRFGNPLEFGFRYQVNELMRTGLPFARPEFMWSNLKWYYLTPPVLGPFFPYVLPIDAAVRPASYYGYELIHGQWLVLPLSALAGLAVGLAWWKKVRPAPPLLAFAATAALAFAVIFAVMLTFGFRANRYVVDFQPMLVAAVVLAGGASLTRLAGFAPTRWLTGGFTALAGLLAVFNFLVGLQWMDHLAITRPNTFAALARHGDQPSHLLARLGLLQFGPVRFTVKFNPVVAGREELLLQIGTSGYQDRLFAIMHPDNRVEFMLTNGPDSLRTPPLKLDFTREQEFEFSIGSLYPPAWHRSFAPWRPVEIQRVKSAAIVLLNGEEIIHGSFPARSQTPAAAGPAAAATPYREVGPIQRLDFGRFKGGAETGLWRFAVRFAPAGPAAQPLLGSGMAGAGNLLFVRHEGPDRLRFALDSWNHGLLVSDPVVLDPATEHVLDIFIGPQVLLSPPPDSWQIPATRLASRARNLLVWLDRRLVWETTIPGNLDSYGVVTLGGNPQGFSTASALFGGTLRKQALSPGDRREILLRLPE